MTESKCPKCGSRSFQMFEKSVMQIHYIVENGRVIANGRTDDGDHISTDCQCDNCGYCWHPRKMKCTIDE